MRLQDLKTRLLGTAPQRIEGSEAIAHMVIEARIARGMTQSQLAKLAGTKQPSIARVENGYYKLRFLEKLAKALNTKLLPPRFAFLEAEKETLDTSSQYAINEFTEIIELVEGEQRMYATEQPFAPKMTSKSKLLTVISK